MYYDYSLMFDRTINKSHDINLFKNSEFSGFVKHETIEQCFSEYYSSASELVNNVSWDYVVLYAVIEYNEDGRSIVSANFMTLEIPYGLYIKALKKLNQNCCLFFIRGRKEYNCE